MKLEELAIVNGRLCRRYKYGGTKPLDPNKKHKWKGRLVKVEELYWELLTKEDLGHEWTVKKVGSPNSPITLDNLVKVMKFPGTYTRDFVRSHFDYDPDTGSFLRRYRPDHRMPDRTWFNGTLFETHRLIWLWMTGHFLERDEQLYFKDGRRHNWRWNNLVRDRREEPRGIVDYAARSEESVDVMSIRLLM